MANNDRIKPNNVHGYGVGYIGQGAAYGFMSTYFVLFLTNNVMLSSSMAAAISSAALLLEVFMGMLVGNMSDSCTSKMGRRRPFMMAAGIAIFPIMFALFRKVSFGGAGLIAYYLVFAMLFRVFFSTFEIPNQAFGAELASGYDERTKLRTSTRIFSIVGNGLGYLLPLGVLALFGDNAGGGWWATGSLIGLISMASWLFSVAANKGKGVILKPEEAVKHPNRAGEIIKNYGELVKLRTGKLAVLYKTAFSCAYSLFNVATIYYLKYSAGFDNRFTSYMYIVTVLVFLAVTPFINSMALRFGKVTQQMFSLGVCGAAGVIIFFLCPGTIAGTLVYMALFAFTQTGFWQVSSAIFYDVIEVDEWVNHKRREGDLMSMISVLGTLISAIMVQIFGFILDGAGLAASLSVQNDTVASMLNVSFILLPGVFLIIGTLILHVFPINKKTFESLRAALDARANGEDYSQYMDDVNKILGR